MSGGRGRGGGHFRVGLGEVGLGMVVAVVAWESGYRGGNTPWAPLLHQKVKRSWWRGCPRI